MRLKKKKIMNVAVALRLSFSSHRDILAGVSHYAKAHHWRLQFVVTHDVNAHENIEMRHPATIDGIISCEKPEDIANALHLKPNIPIASIHSHMLPPRHPNRPMGIIRIGGIGLGIFGAKYLMSLGKFRSFGFVSENHRSPKTDSLLQGFKKQLAKKSIDVNVYPPQKFVAGSTEDLNAIAAWLKSLPKPAAVMATYDLRATQVLDAAHNSGILIPNQVSVIGSDNDELLCDFTTPTLTSIAPNFIQAGKLAAQTLDKLMHRRHVNDIKPIVTTMNDKRIVVRESTTHITPSVNLVERALSFIRKNALSGINAADVVEHICVSRRLADMRFREVTQSSIQETIISLRLKEIKRLLAETNMPIFTITEQCGFKSENHVKNLFHKRFGMSMRDYRSRHRAI